MDSTTRRHILLLSLVLAALVLPMLSGCGVTHWQVAMDAVADLNSPEMDRRIAEAQAHQHPVVGAK